MNTTHTPGPWTVKVDRSNAVTVHEQSGNDLCVMSGNTNDGSNARLIAAAPDLLEALKVAFHAFAFDDEGPVWADSTIAKARAAIAKATGA